jgi:hypothetical protein
MLMALAVLLRTIALIRRGHRAIALENSRSVISWPC